MLKSFPFYQQMEEADCGPACLRMIAEYYGQSYSLDYFRRATNKTADGVSMQDLADAGGELGMRTHGAKLYYENLKNDAPMPAIVFWQGYHFVVVVDVTDEHVVVANPAAEGLITYTKKEFIYNWVEDDDDPIGIVLLFEPTEDFKPIKDYHEEGGSIGSYLWRKFSKFNSAMIQLFAGILVVGILQFSMPFFIMSIVDFGIVAFDKNFIGLVLIGMIAFTISQVLVEFIRGVFLSWMGIQFHARIITEYVAKLAKKPMSYFNNRSLGDIVQRVNDSDRLERFFKSSALFSLFSVVNLVLFSVILLIFDWRICATFLLGTIAYFVYLNRFLKKRREINFKSFDKSTIAQNYLIEMFNGIQDIKLHGAEEQKRWIWEAHLAENFKLNSEMIRLEQWQTRGGYLINEFKNIGTLVLASYSVIEGNMTLGMMVATMFIIGQMTAPINYLVEFFQNYQEANISYERMNEVLSETSDDDDSITFLPENKDMMIENVAFQYGGAGSPVTLKNVNIALPHGKTIAIVGPNGSGKSTLMKIMVGLLKPTVGTVKVGGISLNGIDEQFWFKKIGTAFHEGYIFHDKISKNIALGQEEIDPKRLKEICELVNLQSYIDGLPNHFNTIIGEGANGLSQGLKQRLLLARALYKNPDFLFLDEATNALDSFNETFVMDNIRDHMFGKTIVLIAHRLATVSSADLIIYIEQGEIIEMGRHGELFDKTGAYHHYVRRQLQMG